MKRSLLLVVLCFWLAGAFAQAEWSYAFRGGYNANDKVEDVATTSSFMGISKYVVGSFDYTTWFGSHQLIATGDGLDIFVAKMNPDGTWAWAVKGGGNQYDDMALNVAIDGLGNIYVTGYFQGTGSFGSDVLYSTVGNQPDVFVWKMDTNGNHQWARSGGSSGPDFSRGISCDNTGSAYLTGSFDGHAWFGDIEVDLMDNFEDIFVAKIDPNGNWSWVATAGSYMATNRYQRGLAIHTDYSSGTSYITGYAECPVVFGPHPGIGSAAGGKEIFVASITNWGEWGYPAKVVQGSGTDAGRGIWADLNGNIYITGDFDGTCLFADPISLTTAGNKDIFIAKAGPDLAFQWARRAGGTGEDSGKAIVGSNAIYVGGYFSLTATFGLREFQSVHYGDAFVSKLDTNGNWLCTRQAGGFGDDEATGISSSLIRLDYAITLAGSFSYTVEFSPFSLTSAGASDVFVAGPIFTDTPYGPAPPKNIHISAAGNAITLTWDPVTLDTNGDPHPADYYSIYCSQDPFGSFASQGSTPETSLIQTLAPGDNLPRFYYVKAHYY